MALTLILSAVFMQSATAQDKPEAADSAPISIGSPTASPADAADAEEQLWFKIEQLQTGSDYPQGQDGAAPSEADWNDWRQREIERLHNLRDILDRFLMDHAQSSRREDALRKLAETLENEYRWNVDQREPILKRANELLGWKDLPEPAALTLYQLSFQQLQEKIWGNEESLEAVAGQMEKLAAQMAGRYPEGKQAASLYFAIGQALERNLPERAKRNYRKAADFQDEQSSKFAEGSLRRLDLVGKPLEIKFTALDGREVDFAALKGKVVLVDFWATWCGPCVAELPKVKALYEEHHADGLEIVGISFDQDQSALEKMVQEKDMPWPQYFDGKGWENELGQKFGIFAIPTLFLVDREGKVADVNARSNLEEKVAALLNGKKISAVVKTNNE